MENTSLNIQPYAEKPNTALKGKKPVACPVCDSSQIIPVRYHYFAIIGIILTVLGIWLLFLPILGWLIIFFGIFNLILWYSCRHFIYCINCEHIWRYKRKANIKGKEQNIVKFNRK